MHTRLQQALGHHKTDAKEDNRASRTSSRIEWEAWKQAQQIDYETGRGHTGDGGAAIRIDMQHQGKRGSSRQQHEEARTRSWANIETDKVA